MIESLIGRSTVLFRPPYFCDAEADKPSEVEPAIQAKDLGYLMMACASIPDDWRLPVSADQIVQRTIDRAMDSNPGHARPGCFASRLRRPIGRPPFSAAALDP